jgi:putative chitinase
MREIAPHFSGDNGVRQAKIIAAVGEVLAATLQGYEITTRLRIAHFLGQTCEESAGYRTTEEFASGEEYEGRADLGNTRTGDGPRFKGRGLIQLTGRANYAEYGKALNVDLETEPQLAAEPALSLRIACEYWKRRKVNDASDRDDIIAVTRLVNGRTNGLDDRRKFTSAAKTAVARLEGVQLSGTLSNSETRPVLHRGSKGDAVTQLQGQLRILIFTLAVDGDFGPGTEVAVARFQSENGLAADGIVGPQTWAAIGAAAKAKSG